MIREPIVREFIQSGGNVRAKVTGQQSGFSLMFQIGKGTGHRAWFNSGVCIA
jgi:hypothetical protein